MQLLILFFYLCTQTMYFLCTDRDQMMQNVVKAFNDYPSDKLEDMWASYYNNMRSIMEVLGGNDYKQAHNGGKKRKRDIGASVYLSINLATTIDV